MMRAVLDTSVVIAHGVPHSTDASGGSPSCSTASMHYTRNSQDLKGLADHIEIVRV